MQEYYIKTPYSGERKQLLANFMHLLYASLIKDSYNSQHLLHLSVKNVFKQFNQ